MMGRPKKPTVLKILQGEKRPCRLNKSEPKPEVKATRCPSFLKGYARREYNRLAPKLAGMGLMSDLYINALAQYCKAMQRWIEAERTLASKGDLYVAINGVVKMSPKLQVAKLSFEQTCKIASEFGFTPSAMAHLSVETPDEEDEMAEFLNRAQKRKTSGE